MTLTLVLDLAGDSLSLRRRWIPDPLDQASGLSPCFGKLLYHWTVLWESLAETIRISICLKTRSPLELALGIISYLLCSRMNESCTDFLPSPPHQSTSEEWQLLGSCCHVCLAYQIDSQSFKQLLILLIPTGYSETNGVIYTDIRQERSSLLKSSWAPIIKSQKLNRRFFTDLQIKTPTNTWSLLYAHRPIQTYAASSAKSTAAALFFSIIFFGIIALPFLFFALMINSCFSWLLLLWNWGKNCGKIPIDGTAISELGGIGSCSW